GHKVITPRKGDVMDVKSDDAVSQSSQMHRVMDQAQVLLDLSVPCVVPVTHGGLGELTEEEMEIAFERDLLHGLAVLDAEDESSLCRLLRKGAEKGVNGLDVRFLARLAPSHGLFQEPFVLGRFAPAALHHLKEAVGVVLHLDRAEVQND